MTTLTAYDVRTTTAVTPYSEVQKQGVRDAFDTWEEVSGLTFLELDRGGDMRISMIGEDDMANIGGRPAGGFAYLPFATENGETTEDGEVLGAIFQDSVGGMFFSTLIIIPTIQIALITFAVVLKPCCMKLGMRLDWSTRSTSIS